MAETEKSACEATVHGRVQGVGFRYSARSQARRLGLTGYVRNQPDGTVQVVCEGPKEAVEQFRSWLQSGPPAAKVSRVDERELEYRGRYDSFRVAF